MSLSLFPTVTSHGVGGWQAGCAIPVSRVRLRTTKVERIVRGHKADEKQGKDVPPRVAPQGQGRKAENPEGWARKCGHCHNKTKKLLIALLILKATDAL